MGDTYLPQQQRRMRPQRRLHPIYFEQGTWTRTELERARRPDRCQPVARHQPAAPTRLG